MIFVSNSDKILTEVIGKVLSTLSEKEHFYRELEKRQIKPKNILNNLYGLHEALKSTFGAHHYSVENSIITTLHESTKQGIYREKETAQIAISLIDVFTKEHKKEITATKEKIDQQISQT